MPKDLFIYTVDVYIRQKSASSATMVMWKELTPMLFFDIYTSINKYRPPRVKTQILFITL